MNRLNRMNFLAAPPASGVQAFVIVLLLGLAFSTGAGLMQARAAGRGHGAGQGHGASQGGNQNAGPGGSVGGPVGSAGGAVGGAVAGALNGTAKNSTSGQSGAGGASPLGETSDPSNAKAAASIGPSTGGGNYLGAGAIACATEPDFCMEEMGSGLRDPEPLAAIGVSRQAVSAHRSIDGVPAGTSDGVRLSSGVLAVYSTAELADFPSGTTGIEGGLPKPDYDADTLGWKALVLTTVTGRMASDGPVPADTAATSSDAAAQADRALVGGYHIWIGNFFSERDARRYWARQVRRFPGLLEKLKPTVRRIHPGTAEIANYRLLGGSLASLAAAEHVCGSIQSRLPQEVCRVVLD